MLLLYFAGMKEFETITAFLSQTDWNAHYTMTFKDVCRRFGADCRRMDNLMCETFGMSGEELIEHYRTGAMMF